MKSASQLHLQTFLLVAPPVATEGQHNFLQFGDFYMSDPERLAGRAPAGVPLSRENKHLELDSAIDSQCEAINALQFLINKINSGPSDINKGVAEEKSTPSFINVLDTAPDRIRGSTNQMLQLIDELDQLLF